ncbi:MAG: hypothetical protein QHI38_13850 [Armatimonadota bacterium]|nr:hypothetical protein [Armatimonadota bacterium]
MDLRGKLMNALIPLGGQDAKSMQALEDLKGSYYLVIWELDLGPFGFTPSNQLLEACRRVRDLVAEHGFIYLAVQRGLTNLVSVYEITDMVRQAGLHNCRAQYVLPSHSYPMHFVPVNEPQLMRYYLDHVALARSLKRKRVLELARMLERLRLDKMFLRVVPCFSIVAERD